MTYMRSSTWRFIGHFQISRYLETANHFRVDFAGTILLHRNLVGGFNMTGIPN